MVKRLLVTFAIILFVIGTSSAQGIKVGGGLSYGSEISTIGFRADGVYSINKDYSAAATATYFLTKDNLSWFVLDANAQYVFLKQADLTVYALAGVNMTFWSLSIPATPLIGSISTSGTDTGVNLGTGARKKIGDKLELFGEAKYVVSGAGFFTLAAGVLVPIN